MSSEMFKRILRGLSGETSGGVSGGITAGFMSRVIHILLSGLKELINTRAPDEKNDVFP